MSHPTTAHAVSLRGHLDARVSRWLWLVKMLLAIPHFLVLVPLAVVFLVLTLAAGAAILATGRYPRGIFELTLGILRWNWRVGFYVYAALGTDRYPPFTLGAAPDYPAALDIRYPEASSRGLVLVRWLLAAPHVLIVGHPFVDIWQAVRPDRLGLATWPTIPRSIEWKKGVCQHLGWPHRDQADIARAWQHILGRVRSFADLEPALLGRVEELIDFVTAD